MKLLDYLISIYDGPKSLLDDKRGELYIKKICLKVPDLSMFCRKVKRAELNETKKADAELHNEHLNNDLLRNIFNRNPNLKTAGSEILKNVRAKSTLTAYGRVVKDFKQFWALMCTNLLT